MMALPKVGSSDLGIRVRFDGFSIRMKEELVELKKRDLLSRFPSYLTPTLPCEPVRLVLLRTQ